MECHFLPHSTASGDIRHVIKTVNALPNNYSGHLTILLNDSDGVIISRNLLILAILGSIDDHAQAAEIALHVWYSAFLHKTHVVVIERIIMEILRQSVEGDSFILKLFRKSMDAGSFHINLGEHSTLKGALARRVGDLGPDFPTFYSAMGHLMDIVEFIQGLRGGNKEDIRKNALKSMQNVR